MAVRRMVVTASTSLNVYYPCTHIWTEAELTDVRMQCTIDDEVRRKAVRGGSDSCYSINPFASGPTPPRGKVGISLNDGEQVRKIYTHRFQNLIHIHYQRTNGAESQNLKKCTDIHSAVHCFCKPSCMRTVITRTA